MSQLLRRITLKEGNGLNQLASLLSRKKEEIIGRWLEQVNSHVSGRQVSPTDLRNNLPEYLEKLAEALPKDLEMTALGTEVWREVAQEHALTRVHLGFDISQVVDEFYTLRSVIFDVAREEGLSLPIDDYERITDLIGSAISVAVQSYVEFRDFESRRKEAMRIGFLIHELRNPLTTAMLASSQLKNLNRKTSEQECLFNRLEKSLHNTLEMIEQNLNISRLESGFEKPKMIDIGLGAVLDPLVEKYRELARAKSLEFHATFDSNLLLNVDPSMTSSAIENLLENAVKYTDQGHIELEVEDKASEVVIHVRDTCTGISSEELQVIFEPYQRGHSHKPGTGLGLAISKQSIEAQGGMICAESKGQKGCHFWLSLSKR